jgi:molybdate transport system substrate-binding protein
LLAVPGIELVGPLPDEVQMIFESSAGIFAESKNVHEAEALLQFFSEPSSAAVLKQKGLDPVDHASVHQS